MSIAKPVKYDEITESLVTADGEYISLIIDGDTQRQNAVGRNIASAINDSAYVERLETALKHYQHKGNWRCEMCREGEHDHDAPEHHYRVWIYSDDGYSIAKVTLDSKGKEREND